MNTAKPSLTQTETPAPGLIGSWVRFWFNPIDPVGLHALRVLGGLLFLFWLLPLAFVQAGMFGLGGWLDATAYREMSHQPELPSHLFGWSIAYLVGTNTAALTAIYWVSIAVILLFTLGVVPRITGVLTWVAVVSFTANPALAYDADPLLAILAFYLMVGYLLLGQYDANASGKTRLLGPAGTWLFRKRSAGVPPAASIGANLALRLFQVHFAIAMVASGLDKLQVKEWWRGTAPWYYLNAPFHTSPETLQGYAKSPGGYLALFSLVAYLILAWQIAFPAFAWRRSLRFVLLGGAAVVWLACAIWVPLPLYGPLMIVACLGYLTPAEWRRVQEWAAQLPGVATLVNRLSRVPERPALAGPKGGAASRVSAVSVGGQRS